MQIITGLPVTLITTTDDGLKSFYDKRTITCQSRIDNLQPIFVWYKNGVTINTSGNGYKISADYFKSYLTIQFYSTKQRDDVYNCTAINSAGSSTASIRVTVQGMSKQTL